MLERKGERVEKVLIHMVFKHGSYYVK